MSRRVLSLCFPTCNRKEKLIATVKKLLACSDNRFSITISDNVCLNLKKVDTFGSNTESENEEKDTDTTSVQ